jgi:hypothetical protein
VPESGTLGSVRGASGNGRPYRDYPVDICDKVILFPTDTSKPSIADVCTKDDPLECCGER